MQIDPKAVLERINSVMDDAIKMPKSRKTALVITKLEEARHWLESEIQDDNKTLVLHFDSQELRERFEEEMANGTAKFIKG